MTATTAGRDLVAKGKALARALDRRLEELVAEAQSASAARLAVRSDWAVNRLVDRLLQWYADVDAWEPEEETP